MASATTTTAMRLRPTRMHAQVGFIGFRQQQQQQQQQPEQLLSRRPPVRLHRSQFVLQTV